MLIRMDKTEAAQMLRPLLDTVLTGESADHIEIFRNATWERTALPCVQFIDRRIFSALREASGGATAPRCILTTVIGPHIVDAEAYWSDWDYDAILKQRLSDYIDWNQAILLDGEGRWALQRHWEDFALLGGERAWFRRFLELVGGREVLLHELRSEVEAGSIGHAASPGWQSIQRDLEQLR
jgi:hypothetical protein